MVDDRPVVVKVGGSLLAWDGLRSALAGFLASEDPRGAPPVLIAGGGALADAVRLLDATHGLGEAVSHRLALRAMDVSARALAALVDGSRVVEDVGGLSEARNAGEIPILAPRRFLEEIDERGPDPLPSSWDATSDSIAARVAVYIGACGLILLKSAAASATTRAGAAAAGHVDPVFPMACRGLERVETVDLRDPRRPRGRLD